jgi:hypothetical protein
MNSRPSCTNLMVSAASYPPLQKTQERGTHSVVAADEIKSLGHPPLHSYRGAPTVMAASAIQRLGHPPHPPPSVVVNLSKTKGGPPALPFWGDVSLSSRCEAAWFFFGGGKSAGDDHQLVHRPPRRSKAAPRGTACRLQRGRQIIAVTEFL